MYCVDTYVSDVQDKRMRPVIEPCMTELLNWEYIFCQENLVDLRCTQIEALAFPEDAH